MIVRSIQFLPSRYDWLLQKIQKEGLKLYYSNGQLKRRKVQEEEKQEIKKRILNRI